MNNNIITSTKNSSATASLSSNLQALDTVNFSPALRNSSRIQKELLKRGSDGLFLGGIVHEAVRGPNGKIVNVVHIANPYQGEPLDIVTLPTRCTQAEINQIKGKIIPMRETYELLLALAQAFEQRHPVLLEGDTAIGKTFIVNRFMELLYGKGAKPIDFYCSGQTDVSELLGKWTPKTSGLNDNERKLLDEFLQTSYGKNKITTIQKEIESANGLSQELKQSLVKNKLTNLVAEVGLGKSVQWEFSYGAVPKAMLCDVELGGKIVLPKSGGSGTILKIDEVGLAEPAVCMALLRTRGEAGKLANTIQLWEAGGEMIHAGSDFFIVYTTNPSDKEYIERKEIDPALARSVIWVRKGALSDESLTIAAQKYFTFTIGNDPGLKPLRCVIDLRKEKELAIELAEIAALVHRRYLELMKTGEVGRKQKLPGSLDHFARLANYVLSNQVIDPKSNQVDFTETIKRAIKFVYLQGLIDPKIIQTIEKEFGMLLNDTSVGTKKFRSEKKLRSEILELLSKEAHDRIPSINNATLTSSVSDEQLYSGVTESLLAQLDVKTLSLTTRVLPQIKEALDMFGDVEAKGELLDEFLAKEQPANRNRKEWKEFQDGLNKLRRKVANRVMQLVG